MKKLGPATWISVIFLLLIVPMTAFGQIGIVKGIKGGINIADITGDDAGDTSTRSGFAAGGFLRLGVGILSLQPEVLYTQKGATSKDVEDSEPVEFELKLAYLEIPVLLRVSLLPVPGLKPTLFFGPAFGFLLSSKAKQTIGNFSVEADFKDQTKSMDMGAVVGVGINLGNITVDARYTLGLNSIDDTPDETKLKNGVISVLAGISL